VKSEVDTQGCGLGEDIADLGFELGVKDSVNGSAADIEMKSNEKSNITLREWNKELNEEL
jgi:hypothetical protein